MTTPLGTPHFKYLLIGLAMIVTAGLALALTPREKIADHGPKVDLEAMIPKQFEEWRMEEALAQLMVSPDVKAQLDKIYNQTLSRTYIDKQGRRIMLSIAYGGDQSDSMSVHKPEVCYPSQGFQIRKQLDSRLSTEFGSIPGRRLVAVKGNRVEPLTYWIRIGDTVAMGGKWKLEQIKYGLTGKVPDGLLFRVSSLSSEDREAFALQETFIKALLRAVSPEQRAILFGNNPA